MKHCVYALLLFTIFVFSVGCRPVNSSKDLNIVYFKALSETQYNINDTILELTNNGTVTSIKYTLLDSAILEKKQCKMFYVAIPNFQDLPSDTLHQQTVLAIGKKIGGCEIHVLKNREVYVALITSDMGGEEGERIGEFLKNSWRYDYLLK